jgi:hypothetical protein
MILQRVMKPGGAEFFHENQSLKMLLGTLPEGLRGHVLGVLERSDELVILADSAAWAARLRLVVADLSNLAELATLARGRPVSVRLAPAGATNR